MKKLVGKIVSNSIFLMISSLSATLFSFLFWLIIGKLLLPDDYGVISTTINLSVFLSVVTVFGFGFTLIKLPSGSVRKIDSRAQASLGQVSNVEHGQVVIGKAGRSRHMGIRPTVRGSAMNPVDHPYGGGEGRALRGTRRPKNRWGKGTRGVKTRKRHKYSDALIVSRRTK